MRKFSGESFVGCENLERIQLSKNLKRIGDYSFAYCKSLTTIEIPESVTEIEKNIFLNCDNLTKIYINRPLEEIGGNENAPWGATNAEIIYKPYEDFKESYLENKSQSELEDIFILGYGEYPTFDEYLEGEGLTREQIQEQALEEGLTYEEVFKMAISEDCDGWVQVEFEFEESEFSNKSDGELIAYILEGTEYSTFDQALQAITSDETMNEEKFVQMLQETALRNERNFLKILVVEKMSA